jgi:hypothetical protein
LKANTKPARPAVSRSPESWDIEHWPANVYPHDTSRGRYLVRAYRDELILAGALTRVGRELVVLAAGYTRWLEKRKGEVVTPSSLAGAARRDYELRQERKALEQAVG